MNPWEQARDHAGWLLSAAAALAGYLGRRWATRPADGDPGGRRGSWIGRRLNVERENARLTEDLRSMQESIARREAGWAAERDEMRGQIDELVDRLDRLGKAARATKQAHDAGLLRASAPPSDAPTAPPATSSTSSRKSKP